MMRRKTLSRVLVTALTIVLAVMLAAEWGLAVEPPPHALEKKGPLGAAAQNVDDRILDAVESLYRKGAAFSPTSSVGARTPRAGTLRITDGGEIEVYVYVTELTPEVLDTLKAAGLTVTLGNADYGIVQGTISFDKVDDLASLDFVVRITPPHYGTTRSGAFMTEGDSIINADQVRALLGITGSGVRVGVISDGVDSMAAAQATGDLPDGIIVGSPGSGDEGTALLEIIHDVAPGAELAFSEGFSTSLAFVNSINFLVNTAQVDIIVDDIGFLSQPFFEDGMVALEAMEAVSQGVVFVSSAGNMADRHYQAPYTDTNPSASGGMDDLHDFGLAAGGASDTSLSILTTGGITIVLQWNDPFGSSSNDYDLIVVNDTTLETFSSTAIQDGNDDPIEYVSLPETSTPQSYSVFVNRYSGEPRTLEMAFTDPVVLTEYNVATDSIFGHPAAEGVIAVGAVPVSNPLSVEPFSSNGPVTITFPTPESRLKPDVVAPDGVTVSGAGGFSTPFFGTSAAAPHVAAVAALMLEADPSLTPEEVADTLRNTASMAGFTLIFDEGELTETNTAAYNTASGYGRVDAEAAVEAVLAAASPTPSPSPSPTPTPTPTPSPTQSPPPAMGNSGGGSGGGGGCSLGTTTAGAAPLQSLPWVWVLTPLLTIAGRRLWRLRRGRPSEGRFKHRPFSW